MTFNNICKCHYICRLSPPHTSTATNQEAVARKNARKPTNDDQSIHSPRNAQRVVKPIYENISDDGEGNDGNSVHSCTVGGKHSTLVIKKNGENMLGKKKKTNSKKETSDQMSKQPNLSNTFESASVNASGNTTNQISKQSMRNIFDSVCKDQNSLVHDKSSDLQNMAGLIPLDSNLCSFYPPSNQTHVVTTQSLNTDPTTQNTVGQMGSSLPQSVQFDQLLSVNVPQGVENPPFDVEMMYPNNNEQEQSANLGLLQTVDIESMPELAQAISDLSSLGVPVVIQQDEQVRTTIPMSPSLVSANCNMMPEKQLKRKHSPDSPSGSKKSKKRQKSRNLSKQENEMCEFINGLLKGDDRVTFQRKEFEGLNFFSCKHCLVKVENSAKYRYEMPCGCDICHKCLFEMGFHSRQGLKNPHKTCGYKRYDSAFDQSNWKNMERTRKFLQDVVVFSRPKSFRRIAHFEKIEQSNRLVPIANDVSSSEYKVIKTLFQVLKVCPWWEAANSKE